MRSLTSYPAPGIVVEWDNVLTYGVGRASRSLAALAEQLRGLEPYLDGRAQVVVSFDPKRVARNTVAAAVADSGGRAGWAVDVEVHAVAADASYRDYKNEGFARTDHAVVVFLDTDVIPEADWLENLLAPFGDPDVSVVTGNTYIDRHGLYSRAFALFWFFPPRSSHDGLRPTTYIFPNNVAFRRDVFAQFPFPAGNFFRGKIREHARQIWDGGKSVLQQASARGSHPPPIGIKLLTRRALCQGHDLATLSGELGYQAAWPSFRRNLAQARARIGSRRGELGAGHATVASAACIAFTYYVLVLVGQIVSRRNPSVVRRYFSI